MSEFLYVDDMGSASIFVMNLDKNICHMGMIIEWQNQPDLVLKLLLKFAAHMYFRANFHDFKPKIRVMMASWLFLQKQELRNSDHHNDFIMKERRVYQSLLDSYMKLRKNQDEHLAFLHRLKIQPEVVVLKDPEGNEMPNSDSESST